MSLIRIALLQMAASGSDQDANRSKGEAFCRLAKQMGADVALFPEMWNIGYTFYDSDAPDGRQLWRAQAIGPDGDFIAHFRALARELDLAIAITYLERWPGAPRNSVSLIDRHGEILMTYAKVHTCDHGEEVALTPGDDFYVCTLDTQSGPVQIGVMICFDREFPESARVLMLKGAELILTPNACTIEVHRIAQYRTRAYENMVGVAMTNYAPPQNNGHLIAFDPVAFDEDRRARDTLVVEAGEGEGVFLADFDLDTIREYRASNPWGDAFRRPHRYHLLTSLEVQPPFIRTNADGAPFERANR